MGEAESNKEEKNVEPSEHRLDETNVQSQPDDNEKRCRSCFQKIHVLATVCQHCGHGQSFWRSHFADIATIVSIVMVIIAAAQLIGAFKTNIDASNALETAESAAKDVEAVLDQVRSDANEINALKHIVENQGAMVELVAKEAFKARNLADELSKKNLEMESKLKTLDLTTNKTVEVLQHFQVINDFMMAVVRAQSDSRRAFDQLKTWSEDPNFVFKGEAQQAWIKILDDHAAPLRAGGFSVPWAEGVDPATLSFDQLRRDFRSALPHIRVALLEYIWEKREDIPKKDKMQFLVDTMQSDDNLRVIEYAGRFFTQESKEKIKPLATDLLVDWWKKHKSDYEKTQPEDPRDKE